MRCLVVVWRSESEHSYRAYKSVLGLLALRHSDWASLEEFCSPMGTEYPSVTLTCTPTP